jgi:drug/metabolite transporter (DMT)-like permease
MRKLDQQTIAYIAFAGFCIFSSSRDVLSEFFFKTGAYPASPIFVLFVYSLITQVVAGTILLVSKVTLSQTRVLLWKFKNEVMWLNVTTLSAFISYFFAIRSPLGAALNAFVDYGLGPLFMAGIGVMLLQDRVDKWFALCAAICLSGIAILVLPRLIFEEFSLAWFLGLTLALFSSLSSAIYRVHFKVLLANGMSTSAVVFNRLHATTLVLGVILVLDPKLFQTNLIVPTALIGLFGFCIPLYLILNVIRRMAIPRFAILLFAFPAMTLLLSAGLGFARLYWSDLLAGVLTLVGLAAYDQSTLRDNSTASRG